MITVEPRVGTMAKRNFHNLEVLQEESGPLPSQLLDGDGVGGRLNYTVDRPSLTVIGRLALYLSSDEGKSWRAIPFHSIISVDSDCEKDQSPRRIDLLLSNGKKERLWSSEVEGLLSVIYFRNSKAQFPPS